MKTIIGILVFIVWTLISTHWYICRIKELCEVKKTTKFEPKQKNVIQEIGPFIQEKLNELGIYTIEQISNFTINTVTKVSDAIEYFLGRIQRDFWVEQANEIKSNRKKKSRKIFIIKQYLQI